VTTWFFIAWGILAIVFTVLWAVCVKIRNYGFLDAAWSYGVAMLAPIYVAVGPGAPIRKLVFCGIGVLWSLRLGTYIFVRVLRHHPVEDVRYEALRQRWPGPAMFLAFFQLQAFTVVIFSLPFLFAAWNPARSLRPIELIGLAIAVGSIIGESLADRQMKQFKSEPDNRGKVCEVGLWRFSRHPNYFFEFLFWVGIFIASTATMAGWITAVCPALMYYFLTRVTGIPLTEEYALKSKGEAYRRYQQTTSAFVLWFRRTH
jgi:steroid 5-alpha reductase family enzyme